MDEPIRVHCFRNVSNERAKLLNLHTPGGVEYRRELLALQKQGIEPDDAFSSAMTSSTSIKRSE